MFDHIIPLSSFLKKKAQIIPEQSISEQVNVYEDAIPYIRCQLQSTIQHESGHRADEESRNQQILQRKQNPVPFPYTDLARAAQSITPFRQFVDNAEPVAEREEEDCESLLPPEMTDRVVSINLNQLFEDAKTSAKIDPKYKTDIRAGHLPPEAQGMFMMQDRSGHSAEELVKLKNSSGVVHTDEDDNLWVDVRKIVAPFMTSTEPDETKPPTYQGPGDGAVQADLPGVSRIPPQGSANSIAPIAPAPAVEGREAR